MSYSVDLRRRVILFVQEGGSKTEVARRFHISRQTVHLWVARYGLEALRETRPFGGLGHVDQSDDGET